MARFWTSLRLIIPAVWGGMIIAIDLIEAPLKFQAPGITIPLGLGIGRLVFTAMNWVEIVLALLLIYALYKNFGPTGLHTKQQRRDWNIVGAISGVLLLKVTVLRTVMSSRTNEVIAGTAEPGSFVHVAYIAADAVLAALLVWFLIRQSRQLISIEAARETSNVVGTR